jgi:nucleoside diphosphate kinase
MNGENNDRDDKEPFNVVGCQIVVYEDCPYLVTGITHRTEDVSSKQNDVFIKKVKSFLQRTNLSKIYNKLFPGHSSTACCFPNSDVDLFASDFTTSLSAFVSVTDDPIAVNKAFNSFSSFYSVTLDVGFECTNFALSSNPILSIVQTSVSTFHYALLHQPQQVATVLFRVFQSGLSLSGLRLVYETGNNEPRLVVVLRGNNAIMKWIEEIGPSDPVLARTTDPVSLRALFGGDTRSNTLISCVRNETTSHYEIVHYMGDRVSEDHVVTSFTHSMCKKGISKPFPDCLLISDVMLPKVICHTTSDVLLICSPLCPVTAMGDILQICSDRGFAVVGLKRQRLNKQMGKKLSFTDTNQLRVFTPMLSNSCHPPIPSLIINLVKENAATHVHSLIQHLLLCFPSDQRSLPYFHAVNPTESVLETGLAEFSSVPSHDSTVVLGVTTSYPTSLPQPLFITLSGHRAVALIGKLLCDLFIEAKYFQKTGNTSKNGSVFELVGIKLIPMLSSYLAKQITPFEIGSSQWQASVRSLCNKPTAFILVRSVNGITPATKVINNLSLTNNEVLLCTLRPEAVRLTSSVFKDSELSFDFSCHTLIEYLPDHLSSIKAGVATRIPGRSRRIGQRRTNDQYATSVQESVLNSLIMAPVDIPTVAVLKPHVMQKHLAAILDCLTNKAGFSVVGMDMRRLTVVEAKTLIRDENINEMSLEDLDGHIKSFTSGPSLVLCLMAVNGVKQLLDLLGLQDPKQAKELDPCSLRAIYGVDEQHNGIYASTSYKNAVEDIKLLFPHGLCCSLSPFLHDEGIHCPAIGMDVMDNKNNEHSQNVGNDDNTKEHNGANASTSEGNMSVDLSPTRDNLGDQGQQPASHIVSPPRSLKQTTCIVFPSCLVTETRHDKVSKLIYVDVIRGLITKCGFCPTAMKMVWFNAEEARCLNLIMECSNQTDRFTAGPCVAIALERDNAIVCFDVLADSCLAIKPIYSKYRNEMAISQSSRQAAAMLQFLFSVVYGGLTQEVYLQ